MSRHPLPGSAAYMDQLARGINAAVRKLPSPVEQPPAAAVTKYQIEMLLLQSVDAGDEAMARICCVALGDTSVTGVDPRFAHPVDARDECVRVITEARTRSPS